MVAGTAYLPPHKRAEVAANLQKKKEKNSRWASLKTDNQDKFPGYNIPTDLMRYLITKFTRGVEDRHKYDKINTIYSVQEARNYFVDHVCRVDYRVKGMEDIKFIVFTRQWFMAIPQLQKFTRNVYHYVKEYCDIPTYGGILYNSMTNKVLLVQSAKSDKWSFPKGKMNPDEKPVDSAIREIKEETNISVPKFLINPTEFFQNWDNKKRCTLFLIDAFELPNTCRISSQSNKEIKRVEWFDVDDLPEEVNQRSKPAPGRYDQVCPFVRELKRWIETRRIEAAARLRITWK